MADDTGSPLPRVPDNLGHSWVNDVPGLADKRREIARQFMEPVTQESDGQKITTWKTFAGALEEMLERGLVDIEPQDDRILLRSVIPADGGNESGILRANEEDARKLVCSQVIAVGPDCERFWKEHSYKPEQMLKPGDFCWVLTTVCDRLTAKDKTVRLMTVKAAYIAARVIPRRQADAE